MVEMTPTFGAAALASISISPIRFIPASTTAASHSGEIVRIVMGRPMRLLRLPFVANVLYFRDRIDAIISLTVVLPEEPVTATNGIGNNLRWVDARSVRERRVS